jgi:N-acetylglutamate synthase-like GNAT family acetyltransferase
MSPIRAAHAGDAAELARLAGELGYPAAAEVMARRLERLTRDRMCRVWVAEGDGRLAGWIAGERRLSLEVDERVEITGLVVDGTIRRAGTGRTLVAAVEAWASPSGINVVVVRSNILRETSHLFYQGLGYERSKSQHVYVRRLG